jgi:hypothetical protein
VTVFPAGIGRVKIRLLPCVECQIDVEPDSTLNPSFKPGASLIALAVVFLSVRVRPRLGDWKLGIARRPPTDIHPTPGIPPV